MGGPKDLINNVGAIYGTVRTYFEGVKPLDPAFVDSSLIKLYVPLRTKKTVDKYNKAKIKYQGDATLQNKVEFDVEIYKKHKIIEVSNTNKSLYATVKSPEKIKTIDILLGKGKKTITKYKLNKDLNYSEFVRYSPESEASLKNSKEFREINIYTSKKKCVQDFRENLNITDEVGLKAEFKQNGKELIDIELKLTF